MVDQEKLAKYVQELETYIRHLTELQKFGPEEIISDWRIYDLVDRKLHLAIETFLTIGEMLISEFKFPKPDTYADVPRILLENKVIQKKLAEKLIDLARFRNVLVPGYAHLDHAKVYQQLQRTPRIFKEYIKAVKKYI